MDNDFIFRFINYICSKEQTGNTFSPSEFTDILYINSIKLAKLRIGLEVLPDNSPIKQEFEKNQKSSDSLGFLKKWMGSPTISPLSIDTDGIAQIPSDYLYHSSCVYKQLKNVNCEAVIKKRPVEVLTDSKWDAVSESVIRPPSYKYPVMNYQNGFIRFAPTDLKWVDYVYLTLPPQPKYDYYFDIYGKHVYLPPNTSHTLVTGEQGSNGQTSGVVVSQSVEVGWHESDIVDLTTLILQHVGVNLRMADIVQYSEMIKKQGV